MSERRRRRPRGVLAVVVTTLVVFLVTAPSASAAGPGTLSDTTTSTSTPSTLSTTSTSAAPPETTSTTSTTVASFPEVSGPGLAPPPGSTPEPPPAGGDDTAAPPPHDSGFPAHLQALQDSVVRSGSSSTDALVDALAPLVEHGMSAEELARVGFGRFPLAGRATYSHDWWFPRFGPGWRLHQGTDIFAATGTPVRAPVDGTVRISDGGLGGLAVYVTAADGTYFYLAHLAGTAPGLVGGATVATGDLIGYVGDSGNARGGLPHVHFEVHPRGGEPVDPKPVLDRLLADAEDAVPYLLDTYVTAASSFAPSTVAPIEVPALDWPPVDLVSAPEGEAGPASAVATGGGGPLARLALSAPLRPIAYVVLTRTPGVGVPLLVLTAAATAAALVARRRSGNGLDNDSYSVVTSQQPDHHPPNPRAKEHP